MIPFVASHADVLRGSSRVPAPQGTQAETRDEALRTSTWEAIPFGKLQKIRVVI